MLVVTMNEIPGRRVVRVIGVVRGLTVRSRSIVGNIIAMLESLFGGNIVLYTELAKRAGQEAYERIVAHARSGRQRGHCATTETSLPRESPRFWRMEPRW
jgi:uncharacterized protein YbjQ (UPF0145 family)